MAAHRSSRGSRRRFFKGSLGLAASAALSNRLFASGNGPLSIDSVEAVVIRSPRGEKPPEWYIEMPPVGNATGGAGLWNRLDHASPSRFRGTTQATLVKITTKDGLVGWGECHAPAAPRVHAAVIGDLLAPILIGQDARQVEPLWEKLYSSQRLRGYATGFYTESIAGVDLALWDLLGKYLGQPLYRILGGKYRDAVPTYSGIGGGTPEALAASARPAARSRLRSGEDGAEQGAWHCQRGTRRGRLARHRRQGPAARRFARGLQDPRGPGGRPAAGLPAQHRLVGRRAAAGRQRRLQRTQGGAEDAPVRRRDASPIAISFGTCSRHAPSTW